MGDQNNWLGAENGEVKAERGEEEEWSSQGGHGGEGEKVEGGGKCGER